jgi:predicted dehydrogenase
MLAGEQRGIVQLESTRKQPAESDDQYVARIAESLHAARAQIVWLCVPPGSHIPCLLNAAIEAGVHAIVEKPWALSRSETKELIVAAEAKNIVIGVDFEYCLLDEIQAWRQRLRGGDGLSFEGQFHTSQPDRLGLPALENLGSHLLAIRRYAAPRSEIARLSCSYLSPDERRVRIQSETVDFTTNRQPILQRFVEQFEAATEGSNFEFSLEFALDVAEDTAKYLVRQKAPSQAP